MLTPDCFFDLSNFLHKELFLLDRPVWESLIGLKNYLHSLDLGNIQCNIPNSVTLVHPELISIEEGTVIEPGAYIEGPCHIGKDSQVRQGAYVRPFVLTGERCVIGHASEIKHALFLNGAQAPHFNYVGDSILGSNTNLGAGVICANYRIDHKDVVVEVDGELYETGMRKFGTVLGDRSQIGCNSVINPGVLLRKKTLSRACTSIQKSNLRKVNVVN
ncbi:UDP-N-acetylglucosamine diphosphorylase [Candidatus Neptunochlamydia vexilliferae]|nr:UDP-N-acetylglucosamine diphosphorylase [Candidatus Neptunochlamydia vexilliferae]